MRRGEKSRGWHTDLRSKRDRQQSAVEEEAELRVCPCHPTVISTPFRCTGGSWAARDRSVRDTLKPPRACLELDVLYFVKGDSLLRRGNVETAVVPRRSEHDGVRVELQKEGR